MRSKYYIYHSVLLLLLGIVSGYLWWNSAAITHETLSAHTATTSHAGSVYTPYSSTVSDSGTTIIQTQPPHQTTHIPKAASSSLSASNEHTHSTSSIATSIDLRIGTTTYRLPAYPHETLLEGMRYLAEHNQWFTFSGKEYPGLGFFVQEINGVTAKDGYHWMLYTDGIQSDVGAAQLIMDNYSSIEWKYEQ